jgi:hypothetical protein
LKNNPIGSLTLLLVLTNSLIAFCQTETGFYFELVKVNCEYWADSFDFKNRYCITKDPIVKLNDLEYVGAIQYDAVKQTKQIEIKLSKQALHTLNLLTEKLPNQKLLLVVKQRVVGSFNLKGLVIEGRIDSGEIEWLSRNLKIKKSNP